MVQKFYAIKSEKDINKGTIISTVFAIIVAGGCYFMGGFGRLFSDSLQFAADGTIIGGYDAIVPEMLSNLDDLLIGIIVVLVLSASMSTLSSLVLTSSSTLTLDFIKGNIVKKMEEKKQVFTMRVFIVVFILISVVLAIVQYKVGVTMIAQLMGVSWGALAGAFLAPFLYGLYWKKTTKSAVWASFVFGCGIMIANLIAGKSMPVFMQSPINCGAIAMLAGLIIVPVVSLITPKLKKEIVDDAFKCYEQKVLVSAKESLGETGIEEK